MSVCRLLFTVNEEETGDSDRRVLAARLGITLCSVSDGPCRRVLVQELVEKSCTLGMGFVMIYGVDGNG